MPSGGADSDAVELYDGWYALVYEPAIAAVGLKPYLVKAQDAPVKISDDIRLHIYEDQLALFDLAGQTAAEPPNANVMYELGIRHAFNFPAVLYAWDAARIPFDVGEQRAVDHPRTMGRARAVREEIQKALEAALNGKYYRPMESIANSRLLANAGETNDVIQAIAAELKSVKGSVESLVAETQRAKLKKPVGILSLSAEPPVPKSTAPTVLVRDPLAEIEHGLARGKAELERLQRMADAMSKKAEEGTP
jgi:hypothetical protein